MALSIPLADIMAYRKVARAYFALLDVLCHNHAQVCSHPCPLVPTPPHIRCCVLL